jgi:hypothetical protein
MAPIFLGLEALMAVNLVLVALLVGQKTRRTSRERKAQHWDASHPAGSTPPRERGLASGSGANHSFG